jgi:hypothetical protein
MQYKKPLAQKARGFLLGVGKYELPKEPLLAKMVRVEDFFITAFAN